MTRKWKRILRLVLTIAAAICLSAAVANSAKAQDRATVVPGMKVLFENDCVRVQYQDVAVGGKVPMHSRPAYIVYTLKPFKARLTLPDGTQRISEHKVEEAYWNPPSTHSVENLGNTDIHNLIVELKPAGKCQ